MIVYSTGTPGSGKSYFVAKYIFDNFDEEEKKNSKRDYINCYTNLNEFKYDKFENVFSLDFDELLEHLTTLHKLYKKKATDEELIEKCKELNIYKTLFVIDECHNFLDTKNTVLIWWLSYHRHLFHDIYLVTQHLTLVEPKYKHFSEFFYKAKSTSLSVNRSIFYYDVFMNSRLSQKSKSQTIKVKKDDRVFAIYKSGDKVEAPNVILRLIILATVLISLLVVGFLFFKDYIFPSDSVPTNKEPVHNPTSLSKNLSSIPKQTVKQNDFNIDTSIYITLDCTVEFCLYKNTLLPITVINKFKDNFYFEVVSSKQIGKNLIMYVFTDSKFDKFLGVTNNDKKTTSFISSDTKLF